MIEELQKHAIDFLNNKFFVVNGINIYPKEIEAYYFKEGEFEDNSVHRNDLQQNHPNRFYIHRWGKSKDDPYKGGNYPGIDFVVSSEASCYYTYLLRSVEIEEKLVIGPHMVLEAIKEATGAADYNELENMSVSIANKECENDILISIRINLGKTVDDTYKNAPLRFVELDEHFRNAKYPLKEKLITDYLIDKMKKKHISKEDAIATVREKLGYLPASIKNS